MGQLVTLNSNSNRDSQHAITGKNSIGEQVENNSNGTNGGRLIDTVIEVGECSSSNDASPDQNNKRIGMSRTKLCCFACSSSTDASPKQNTQSHNRKVSLLTEPLESAAYEASNDDLEDIKSKLIREIRFSVAMKKTPDSDELVEGKLDLGESCNGLICTIFEHQGIFLWNLTIEEAKKLGKLNDFDLEGTFCYGFAYDSSTDDYKIVRAMASYETQVEVLALKSNI
ncbi:putative ubiquitin-protein ligase [Corchorus olitorius]|uniref:Ubiquitin-protein ligase n=1 Tax=Corchorus olitorius TaxID=93759 RepID=A0A1R3GGR7_9ROSI|nr:putative ubiquitin-protein ligase [Corchorus olitorius]